MHLSDAIRRRIAPQFGHVHDTRQHERGVADVRHADGDRPKALDLMLGRNRAPFPWVGRRQSAVVDEPEALALAVLEIEGGAAVDFGHLTGSDLQLIETALPPPHGFGAADPKPGPRDAVRAASFASDRPVEEGQIRAGGRLPVGIEEMIGRGVVLVDGLLDQAETQRPRVEAQVLRRIGGYRSQMVDTSQLQAHDCLLIAMLHRLLRQTRGPAERAFPLSTISIRPSVSKRGDDANRLFSD